jgi:hypothetical protein
VRVALVIASLGMLAIASPSFAFAQTGNTVHVRTTSTPRGVWLHALYADAGTDLCPAPCEVDIPVGTPLGLSIAGTSPRRALPVALTDGALLQLRFDDQHLTRTYGLIVTVIGAVAALTLGLGGLVAWLSAGGVGDMTGPVTSMVSAAGALALGLGVGIVLMNEDDHVEITVVP